MSFWTTYFNFKPSDVRIISAVPTSVLPITNHLLFQVNFHPDGHDMVAFMHLDRGLEFVDHHCFFFFSGPKAHIHHSSFEVFDFDAQVMGHDYLIKKGYENCWGVGRHVAGSQIFDYW